MEKYIKPLQEYLDDNYSDIFGVMIGEYDYDLVIFNKETRKKTVIISTYEYGDDEFEIYTFENCRFKFIDDIVNCLKEFDERK